MKYIILLIFFVSFFSGCSVVPDNSIEKEIEQSTKTDTEAKVITQETTEETTADPVATEVPALGDSEKVVDSIGPSSYEELAKLSGEKKSKVMSYEMEHCYFKMKNIPEDYKEVYVSIWEIGFFADYENPKTNERIELNWWANRKPEDYEISIQDVRNLKVISKDGIDYYCSFVSIEKEPSDTTEPSSTPHHAEIRWIEDEKCFYVNVVSATPLDESVLKYCELEKFSIN